MRITEIKPEYVDNVPALSDMKEGVLYGRRKELALTSNND